MKKIYQVLDGWKLSILKNPLEFCNFLVKHCNSLSKGLWIYGYIIISLLPEFVKNDHLYLISFSLYNVEIAVYVSNAAITTFIQCCIVDLHKLHFFKTGYLFDCFLIPSNPWKKRIAQYFSLFNFRFLKKISHKFFSLIDGGKFNLSKPNTTFKNDMK